MPHKAPGMKNFRIDTTYRAVGRIARTSGTTDRSTYREILVLLDRLYAQGEWEILRAIKDGELVALEVLVADRAGKLDTLLSPTQGMTLSDGFAEWVATHDVTEATRNNYRYAIKHMTDRVQDCPVEEVPSRLKEYRAVCVKEESQRMFNSVRTALLSFFKHTHGKTDPLYTKTAEVPRLKEPKKAQAPSYSVKEMGELIGKLQKGDVRDTARTLLFSGMNWKEYAGEWELEEDRVRIHGTKAKGRDRVIPRFEANLSKPTVAYSTFRRHLRKADGNASPYSFRRTLARWMAEAGIPKVRRSAYMGHSPRGMTERYEEHDVEEYLVQDAETLSKWLAEEWEKEEKEESYEAPANLPFQMLKST